MVTFSGMNTSPFNNFNPQDAVSVVAVAAASNGSSNNKADCWHCSVPEVYKKKAKRGQWVMTQRRQYSLLKEGVVSYHPDRVALRLVCSARVYSGMGQNVSVFERI
eukprot:g5064.t1 g5064   contig18:545406-546196(+)